MKVQIIANTKLKPSEASASTFKPDQLVDVKAGEVLDGTELKLIGKHYSLKLKDRLSYIWYEHAKAIDLPTEVKLDVQYNSQLDNRNNPTGSCNVTSLAMCLRYFGASANWQGHQLEDWLYANMSANGLSRHSPADLVEMYNRFAKLAKLNTEDAFDPNATVAEMKSHLAKGYPLISHGYFTNFGHVIVVIGYDAKGFWVHDPYGEFDGSNWTYANMPADGKAKHYSYKLMAKAGIPANDNSNWVHFCRRKA